ncbi:hypothetical protein [Rahnella sp. AN3-3W3]|uniref:tail fiber/spike domain-containing protein n=1 Tax=Rahnella sp. AN3-3W3 TaxID=1610578 RepID=UPI000DD3A2F3|nr:hypothetical protein [Rahnella sp. AN3-3W3]
MTVSTEIDSEQYIGNGLTTTFPFRFRILQNSNMVVTRINLSDVETVLVLGTDYTLTGVGGYYGGNVVLSSPLPNGYGLTLVRDLPITQETDLRNQGAFFAEVHEDAFDKLTMLIQQVWSWFGLALRRNTPLSKYYDAKGYRIANLLDPVNTQDASTKGYVDKVSKAGLERALRVPEAFINELPQAIYRANKAIGFDSNGSVIVTDPAATGLWGYALIDSFQIGAVITERFDALRWSLPDGNGEYYRWDGNLPKNVLPGSTPETSGGVGIGAWLSIGDASLRPLVEVTANVVGSNNYSTLPQFAGYITAGNDYLYQNVLYTTVGDSGIIQFISGNTVTTDTGTVYLLDKRWSVNDVRAWGVQNDSQADTAFKNAVNFINKAPGGKRTVYVPPIALILSSIELRDLANLTIYFDGTYLIGNSTTVQTSMIDIVNAHTVSITGSFIAAGSNKYTYAIRGRGGLPSSIAPETGIFTSFDMMGGWKFNTWNCALCFGDGTDKQVSEINVKVLTTNKVNCCVEVNGSQTIVSVEGSCVCEPVSGFTYKKGVFNIIGGVINHTSGEAVSSIDAAAPIVNMSQASSTQYSNPFGSARLNGVHVETVSSLVSIKNSSGISGSSFSGHSDITFSMCSGAMLNGGIPLIENQVSDYAGTVNIADTCNFYSATNRTSVVIYSTSSNMTARVGDSALRDGFTTIAENISPQCNWQHDMRPIAYLEAASVSIPASTAVSVSFPSRLSTGDYKYYYANTNNDGFNVATHIRQMEISVYMPSSGAEFRVSILLNGVEYFSCISGGTVTIPGNRLPIGAEIRFACKNTSGSTATLANTARVVITAANY